jgi:hypothetical protein
LYFGAALFESGQEFERGNDEELPARDTQPSLAPSLSEPTSRSLRHVDDHIVSARLSGRYSARVEADFPRRR